MRKFLLCLCILALLLLPGCDAQVSFYTAADLLPERTEPPTFLWPEVFPEFPDDFIQTLREDAEEHAEVLMTRPNDFHLNWTPRTFHAGETSHGVILFVTNRLGMDIKNVSFDLTVRAGDVYLLQDSHIYLSEGGFGIIPDNTIIPLLLGLSPPLFEMVMELEGDAVMHIGNFAFDLVP